MEEGRGSELARMYWEELKEKGMVGKVESGWEEERRRFFNDRGVEMEEVEKKKNGRKMV